MITEANSGLLNVEGIFCLLGFFFSPFGHTCGMWKTQGY